MIIDASALLAILLDEPDRAVFERRIAASPDACLMSPVNYLEAAVRADNEGHPRKGPELDPLMQALSIAIEPLTAEQAKLAREAYQRFGKGNHPARLNLGDCFAYALARARSEPLLFKGQDFPRTDVACAL